MRASGISSASPSAISLRGLHKSFGAKVAVRSLDLEVPRGALYGLIGPNGAGKTTTIRMIMSILFPDAGEVEILGRRSALEAKDRIGYLPEERGVYRKMKVGAFLRYMGRLKGIEGPQLDGRVRSWLARVGLAEVEGKRCEELSKGMQQKVQFISAVLHEPELLILDEPFSGLDPLNMRLLRGLIEAEHRRGATVVFSTHVMVQAEQICDHVVMIHDGEKVLDESLTGIRSRYDPRVICFEPLDVSADLSSLGALPMVSGVRAVDGGYEVDLVEDADLGRTMRELAAAVPAARLEVRRPSLEDVFIQLVGEAGQAAGEGTERLRAALRGAGEGVAEA